MRDMTMDDFDRLLGRLLRERELYRINCEEALAKLEAANQADKPTKLHEVPK